MAIQIAISLKNARLDAVETEVGPSPYVQIRTGAPPEFVSSPDTGTVLATINCPADWMADAVGGSKSKLGTWSGVGLADGVAGHFRLYNSGGSAQIQGTVTGSGGGGDAIIQNVNIAVDQPVAIIGFTLSE